MPRSLTPLPPNTEKHMRDLLRRVSTVWEHRRIQCVLLRAREMRAEDIAPIVGLHTASVWRIWAGYLSFGDDALLGEKRGKARGNAHLSLQQEKQFLQPFFAQAEKGQLLTVRMVHAALRECIGNDISPVTTFRMLRRHGWRKIVPLPAHPKGNKSQREKFKKAFSPTH